jgi:hypothetical protein
MRLKIKDSTEQQFTAILLTSLKPGCCRALTSETMCGALNGGVMGSEVPRESIPISCVSIVEKFPVFQESTFVSPPLMAFLAQSSQRALLYNLKVNVTAVPRRESVVSSQEGNLMKN